MPAPKIVQMTKKNETRNCQTCGERFSTNGTNRFNCDVHAKKVGFRAILKK